jgi:hypothetical protein
LGNYPPKRERLSDLELIEKWLSGELRSKRNQDVAKEMLRLLLLDCVYWHKPLPRFVGFALWHLFDARQVKLTFKHQPDAKRQLHYAIALYIAREHAVKGTKLESVIAKATGRFGVAPRTVTRAWRRYRKPAVEWAKRVLPEENSDWDLPIQPAEEPNID